MVLLLHPLNCCDRFPVGGTVTAFIDDESGQCYTGAAGGGGFTALVDVSRGNRETAAAGWCDFVFHAVRSFRFNLPRSRSRGSKARQ